MSKLSLVIQGYKLETPVRLIGIVGHAGAGKDTIADRLESTIQYSYTHPFALFLKEACLQAFGIEHDAVSREYKEIQNPFWGVSPRQIWQYFGTEMFRALDEDFWIKRMIGHIDQKLAIPAGWAPYEFGDTIIIPDVRFNNEVDFIEANNGKLIHVTREGADGKVGLQGHLSESGISWERLAAMHHIGNNGTIEELYLEVDNFVDTFIPIADRVISDEQTAKIVSNL